LIFQIIVLKISKKKYKIESLTKILIFKKEVLLAEKELEKNSISNADEILSIIDQAFQKKNN